MDRGVMPRLQQLMLLISLFGLGGVLHLPAQGVFDLTNEYQYSLTKASDQQYVFELIDMQGKLVVQERLNNARLNVDLESKSLVSGIYVYRIMDDEKVLDSGRVVIK